MNMKISFRGKHIYSDVWTYGFFLGPDSIFSEYYDQLTGSWDVEEWTIDAKTIGHYTGLDDKNGREIFVGDILRFDNGDTVYLEMEDWLEVSVISVGDPELEDQWRDLYRIERAEVIGNIHDNPELLNE